MHRSFIYETDASLLTGILLALMLMCIYLSSSTSPSTSTFPAAASSG
jgi:hypothetical protein